MPDVLVLRRVNQDIFRLVYRYRVAHPIAAGSVGAETSWMRVAEIPGRLGELESEDAVTIWRPPGISRSRRE
jgi:hypothetical protein